MTTDTPKHDDHNERRRALRIAAANAVAALQNSRNTTGEAIRRAYQFLSAALDAEDAHDIAILTAPDEDEESSDEFEPVLELPGRYEVTIGDCAGPRESVMCVSFTAALNEAVTRTEQCSTDRIVVVNLDSCDEEHDGLTIAQREALGDAIDEARERGRARTMPAIMPPTALAAVGARLSEIEEQKQRNARK